MFCVYCIVMYSPGQEKPFIASAAWQSRICITGMPCDCIVAAQWPLPAMTKLILSGPRRVSQRGPCGGMAKTLCYRSFTKHAGY